MPWTGSRSIDRTRISQLCCWISIFNSAKEFHLEVRTVLVVLLLLEEDRMVHWCKDLTTSGTMSFKFNFGGSEDVKNEVNDGKTEDVPQLPAEEIENEVKVSLSQSTSSIISIHSLWKQDQSCISYCEDPKNQTKKWDAISPVSLCNWEFLHGTRSLNLLQIAFPVFEHCALQKDVSDVKCLLCIQFQSEHKSLALEIVAGCCLPDECCNTQFVTHIAPTAPLAMLMSKQFCLYNTLEVIFRFGLGLWVGCSVYTLAGSNAASVSNLIFTYKLIKK